MAKASTIKAAGKLVEICQIGRKTGFFFRYLISFCFAFPYNKKVKG